MTGGSTAAPKTPPFKATKPPPFIKADPASLEKIAVAGDVNSYGLSDADFSKRHGKIAQSEKLFEASVLDDQMRKDTFTPIEQATNIQSGLANANSAFGDATGAGLNPSDSDVADAREASIAKNLGLGLMDVQQRNRANRNASLTQAEAIFPRRTFGMGGNELANIELANTAGQNNFNQGVYSVMNQAGQVNSNIAAGNASNVVAQQNAQKQAEAQQKAQAAAAAAAITVALIAAA